MKLADISNGADWIMWVVFVIFLIISIVLLSGHGSWFISGYNTASKEEKAKYDEKKLCKTTGFGMAVIAVLILVMGLFEDVLPASFAYISLGIILVDVLLMIVVCNTVCRK
ncbi:MAG: DUF3784 domain-containing protein [Lachnospiraceae bacterium]|nr:DUF3784 domain-containing protein [Lachnospiraceae bacterium]